MPTEINIDLTPVVAAILEVALDPYKELVETLERQGRLSEDELTALDRRLHGVRDRLPELTRAALAEWKLTR